MKCVFFCFVCFTIGFFIGGNSMIDYHKLKVDNVISE